MNITSKQRAYLRSLANNLSPIYQIGKNGISEKLIQGVSEALEANELIKITVLETAPEDAKETAIKLSNNSNSVVVQVLGRKITLYRKRKKDSKISIDV